MDSVDLVPLLEQLEDNIDDLEDALEPLLKAALSETAAKLPLLDKAKLYVLVTYAIESILFSFLRLNGVNARNHPVFRELTRVKQYFEKIKSVEFGDMKRENLSLNKPAAGRIIKHALAGNEKYDLQRAEQQAKERARAHIRFEQIPNKRKADEDEGGAVDAEVSSSSSSESEAEHESSEPVEVVLTTSEPVEVEQPVKRKKKRRQKKRKDVAKAKDEEMSDVGNKETLSTDSTGQGRKRLKRKIPLENTEAGAEEETILPSKSSEPPLGHSEAFQALLNGPRRKRNRAPRLTKRERDKRKEAKGAPAD